MIMGKAIFKIGTFGTHITENPTGTFSFTGTVPKECNKSFETFDIALKNFLNFFKSQSIKWQRENIHNLRNDVFAKFLEL